MFQLKTDCLTFTLGKQISEVKPLGQVNVEFVLEGYDRTEKISHEHFANLLRSRLEHYNIKFKENISNKGIHRLRMYMDNSPFEPQIFFGKTKVETYARAWQYFYERAKGIIY